MSNTFEVVSDSGLSREEFEALKAAFDPVFYRAAAGRDKMNDDEAFGHFLAEGWQAGLDPSPDFSIAAYRAFYPDLAETGENPFVHYILTGRAQGYIACDAEVRDNITDAALAHVRDDFDADFYRRQSGHADWSDEFALLHYMALGWRDRLDPEPGFSTGYYLDNNDDIRAAGSQPYLHYHVAGRNEGRLPHADPAYHPVDPDELAAVAPHFHARFYRRTNPDLGKYDEAALLCHYMNIGWKEGRDPSPDFSTEYYITTYHDIADSRLNPLLHYAIAGQFEGRTTRDAPEDDAVFLENCERVREFFDAGFYRNSYPEIEGEDGDLLHHYMIEGWKHGYDPSPKFSTTFYIDTYDDIRKAALNPLLHYAIAGRDEGRQAYEGQPVSAVSENDFRLLSEFFDPAYYAEHATGLDEKMSDRDLLAHYLENGWKQGLDPSPQFSTSFYLETYSDIRTGGLNPLLHFVVAGQAEGRKSHPNQVVSELSEHDLITVADYFDAEYYRAFNEDVTGTDRELLVHYMSVGWREGRDPAADFSTAYYLDSYADIRDGGINPLLHYAVSGKSEGRRPMGKGPVRVRTDAKADIIPDHMKCVMGLPAGAPRATLPSDHRINPAAMDLHWIIPDFNRGGGGHMTIFRMIRYLELFGHRCTIWIEHPRVHDTADEAYQDIVKYFQCVEARVAFVKDGFAQATGDAIIATAWSTAYLAEATDGFAAKYYFVQDHEVEFYPTGSDRLMARRTYDFDLAAICASPWLGKIMTDEYGRWARHFHLAYDQEQYRITNAKAHKAKFKGDRTDPVRIAVYARGHTARRCVDLALMALDQLAGRALNFEVHFFGQDRLPFLASRFSAFNHGVVEADDLAQLYRDCDLGICFSATNYSLVPQEMMACGLPVFELDTESTREIFPDGTVTLAGPDPSDMADKLSELIKSPNLRQSQARNALEWVGQFTWEGSARMVEQAIIAYLQEATNLCTPAVQPTRELLLDVIIPTYNGMGELEPVIAALRCQKHADQLQIHCIDSSSSDGTTEWLRDQADIATTVIDQKTFQHGRTRNEAIAQGNAPFVGVLTQDALPATEFWATDILKMMHHYPEAAGLYGRHMAYPDHPTYVQEEIRTHFENMLKRPLALSKDTDPEKWEENDRSWHQYLHFYSDNNSAMRRSVWEEMPYPEVDYGEDQIWAYQIIKAGHTKLYAPSAVVYHSHDYGPEETYKRSRIEGAFFHRYFGYELGHGTERQVKNRIARERENFRKWARLHNVDGEELGRRRANIAEKYRGWRDGVAESKAELGADGAPAAI